MNNLLFYVIMMLIVIVILAIIIGQDKAIIVAAVFIFLQYIKQQRMYSPNRFIQSGHSYYQGGRDVEGLTDTSITTSRSTKPSAPQITTSSVKLSAPESSAGKTLKPLPKPLPKIKPEVLLENAAMVDNVFNGGTFTADDKLFDKMIHAGYKNKKAIESRSHWNSDNQWKKYYDYELHIHEDAERDWWNDDDLELTRAGHVVI